MTGITYLTKITITSSNKRELNDRNFSISLVSNSAPFGNVIPIYIYMSYPSNNGVVPNGILWDILSASQ